MEFNLRKTAAHHRVIASHRGVSGGNIPGNTIPAYEIALMQGSDMIETDISACADGTLVVFHPNMEKRHLDCDCKVPEMPYEEVAKLRYVNRDRAPTQFGLVKFDDFLETFKGRCYINIDKFWNNPEAIYKAIKRHNMLDQILVKSSLKPHVIEVLEDLAPDIPFMPIVKNDFPEHKELLAKNINYIGVEFVFSEEDAPCADPEYIRTLQKDNILVWGNAIIYNVQKQLAAGHSDDTSFTVSPDYGWGWLADRGFDIIQTDWPGMLIDYLKKAGKYYRVNH